ncbi:RUN domain-containing protein [Aphelenchoides avenae]|nr:RUN domain-containing protein [Aphelenchus avenae]
MVELCELKLMSSGVEWPPDIDQHVAQLDFGSSSIDQSLFASMALDPTLISTDSLDMDTLRMRCETNKNDYKLTFEDSGQWTTSGIGTTAGGGTTSPSDVEVEAVDQANANNFTTWGRIRSTDLPAAVPGFDDEKTTSLPELNRRSTRSENGSAAVRLRTAVSSAAPQIHSPSSANAAGRRPASLVANFVERQQNTTLLHGAPPTDYEYHEVYVGDGRYVDVNENEIGFTPPSTAPLQRSQDRWPRAQRLSNAQAVIQAAASAVASSSSNHLKPPPNKPPRRTFADLSPSDTAPELKFLALPHAVPSFCRPSVSLDDMFKRAQQQSNAGCLTAPMAECDEKLLDASENLNLFERNGPDSGFESSSSGPLHIEDWPSLAVLLPSHVVEACSFFKTNSALLTGSSNNIDRKLSVNRPHTSPAQTHTLRRAVSGCTPADAPCRTCFSVRKRIHPPNWAQPPTSRHVLCDCSSSVNVRDTTSSEILPQELGPSARSRISLSSKLKLHAQELSIIGLPIYAAKRGLVEHVVEGVAEIARGASTSIVLWSALERLLADGLKDGLNPWNVVLEVTGPGPATNSVYALVKEIEASEKPQNSRVQHFFREVLNLYSLDGWLSYVVLKEHVLERLYTDSAFLLRANTAYRSLFWRLIESLELLSVLCQCSDTKTPSRSDSDPSANWRSASKIPCDSRVPKSSSVPSRLSSNTKDERKAKQEQAEAEKVVEEKQEPSKQAPSSSLLATTGSTAHSQPSTSASVSSGYREMRRSRIPVSCTRSVSRPRSRSNFSANDENTPSTSQLSPVGSATSHFRSRSTTTPVARVREEVPAATAVVATGGATRKQRLLPLQPGERVRVLSVRGPWTRCCRLHMPRKGLLTLMNGAVPTQFLDLC